MPLYNNPNTVPGTFTITNGTLNSGAAAALGIGNPLGVNVSNNFSMGSGAFLGRGCTVITLPNNGAFSFDSSADAAGSTKDTGISRTNATASGAGVVAFGNGTAANASGFLNWGGQSRVTANATSTTATMTAVPGLTATLSAGRTYAFEVNMFTTATTIGGIKAAMSGSAVWTNIRYEGSVLENNTVAGYVVAAAITTNVATLTAAATGFVTIKGLGTVSTAGTLTVNFGQNATAAGATTIQSGSYMIVHDMP